MNKDQKVLPKRNLSARSALSFLLVGGFATGLHYMLTILFVAGFGIPLIPASAAGFAISAIANYLLNARLTFQSDQPHKATAPRFIATTTAGLLLNSLLLSLLVSIGFHAVSAQLLTTLGVLIWNYSINSIWTFKKRTS
jgi:putative flippase GtrA